MATRSGNRRTSTAPSTEIDFGSLKPVPVYLLFGEDEFKVSGAARRLIDHLCPEADRAFGLEIMDLEADLVADALQAIGRCVQGLQTLGFFGGRKTVWLRDAQFFGSLRTMGSQEVKDALDGLVSVLRAGLPDGTHLVVNAPKIDKRSTFYRACKELGATFEFALPGQSYKLEEHARAQAREFLKQANLLLDEAMLHEFVARAGTDTRQLAAEVEKLDLYLGERREPTIEDLRAMVSTTRESAGWDLADAVAERDLRRALRMVRQLDFQGMKAVGMAILLSNRFRELLVVRNCVEQGYGEVVPAGALARMRWRESPEAEEALSGLGRLDVRKINEYRAGILGRQARKFSRAELILAHQICIDTHLALITSALPGALPIELLLLRILGRSSGK